MASITKKMSAQEIQELKESLASEIIKETQPQYTYYQIKTKDQTVTAYTSGKVVFQGKDIESYAPEKKKDTDSLSASATLDAEELAAFNKATGLSVK